MKSGSPHQCLQYPVPKGQTARSPETEGSGIFLALVR